MSARTSAADGPAATAGAAGVAGSPPAMRVLRDVVAAPETVRRLDVVGPGGHGKTVLLDALATAFRTAGITVRTDLPAGPLGAGEALLVDDAHLLGPGELRHLAQLTGGWLVVAHRPWPRSPELTALGAVLAARRTPVVLGPLDATGVAVRAERLLGRRLDDRHVAAVLDRTGGVPLLVDRLLTASDGEAGLIAQLGYLLAAQPAGVVDLLLHLAAGAPLDAELLGPLLGLTRTAELDEHVEAAIAAGLLRADGRPIPLVCAAVLARTPPASRTAARRALAERELDRGGNVVAVARGLAGTGATGPRMAELFTTAGDELLRSGAPDAEAMFAAAVAAGAPPLSVAARRAHAALVRGDVDTALAEADRVLSAGEEVPRADTALAGTVAAAALARRGLLGRSAELYRYVDSVTGRPSALAVPVLIGTGSPVEPQPHATGVPTLLAGAEDLVADGIRESVAGSPTAALSLLTRAAAMIESDVRAVLLPDHPAALAAIVAVHCGELEVARSVLERALRSRTGGRGAAPRHRLLLGWIALARGTVAAARAALTGVGRDLEPRDEFLAAALEVAIARRTGDLAALMPAWGRAREAVVRHPVDLYMLHELGELAIAATRLREPSWVAPHLAEADALLARLGDPPLWAAPLHWGRLQAAILAEDREEAARHAAALERAAGGSRYAAAMATAAPHWVRMLDADVDPAAVEAAARGLHAVGMSWEGGKLAGQAAIRTRDRKAMTALLQTARALQATGSGPDIAADAQTPPSGMPAVPAQAPQPAPAEESGPLSEREREVAALLVEGKTYKEIGEQLFISAKTVEHHVARMRQRLGATSRGELFAQLRQIVQQQ
ncbi:helix-turn-helix transcriptional regulator [Pseudonocardia thermophila]|nr:helix-turn-helix transcriptional regulator [Pseudonocardia thermophila]